MRAKVLFRIAAILILLFAVGHTLGFWQIDPQWGIGGVIEGMRSTRFVTQGFQRTYWDFYIGFGLFVSVFLAFSSLVAWQLGALPEARAGDFRVIAWALVLVYAITAVLSWRFFFVAPMVFSAVICGCLLAATLRTRQATG